MAAEALEEDAYIGDVGERIGIKSDGAVRVGFGGFQALDGLVDSPAMSEFTSAC